MLKGGPLRTTLFAVPHGMAALAAAQAHLSRPVRIVIPLSPGGTTGVPERIITQRFSETPG